jgi:hypothetical protein
MVNDSGQMYTIEGFAAALIILASALLVLNTTTALTPGDQHIAEMQLEQLGSDALAMMDTPGNYDPDNPVQSELETYIVDNQRSLFNSTFYGYLGKITGETGVPVDDLQYSATLYYRKNNKDEIGSAYFASSSEFESPNRARDHIGREPAVRVSRWVYYDRSIAAGPWKGLGVSEPGGGEGHTPLDFQKGNKQMLLLEVLIWRG